VLRGGFLEAQTRCGDLALCLELVRLTAEEPVLAASFTLDFTVHRSGEPVEVPSAWRELVASSLCELPATSALRGLDAHQAREQASLAAADELGLLPIQRGPVAERECGAQGLSAAAIMGRLSAGIPHLILSLGGVDRSEANLGGAALEYRFRFRRAVAAGASVVVRSGLAGVNAKTRTFVHWVLDAESGEAVATAEAVAVSLDLEARRLATLSEEAVAAYQARVVPGLSL
ncbi:MAG: thioesterase family protein, partial [Acidobacteriota bacterium]